MIMIIIIIIIVPVIIVVIATTAIAIAILILATLFAVAVFTRTRNRLHITKLCPILMCGRCAVLSCIGALRVDMNVRAIYVPVSSAGTPNSSQSFT